MGQTYFEGDCIEQKDLQWILYDKSKSEYDWTRCTQH